MFRPLARFNIISFLISLFFPFIVFVLSFHNNETLVVFCLYYLVIYTYVYEYALVPECTVGAKNVLLGLENVLLGA